MCFCWWVSAGFKNLSWRTNSMDASDGRWAEEGGAGSRWVNLRYRPNHTHGLCFSANTCQGGWGHVCSTKSDMLGIATLKVGTKGRQPYTCKACGGPPHSLRSNVPCVGSIDLEWAFQWDDGLAIAFVGPSSFCWHMLMLVLLHLWNLSVKATFYIVTHIELMLITYATKY